MPTIAKRVEGASTWYASCADHPRFRSLRGSMNLAIKQADAHNKVLHPLADKDSVVRAALRERKEAGRG